MTNLTKSRKKLFVEIIADISNIEKSRTGEILKEKNDRIERMNSQDMDDYVQKGKFFEQNYSIELTIHFTILLFLTDIAVSFDRCPSSNTPRDEA